MVGKKSERPGYIKANKLRFLRPYQLKAIHRLQAAVGEGKDRFLFEMATGTGKTLTAAAVIKLFLRSGNVRRILFLVDRLELEDQAKKAFAALLSADFQTVIYKENRDDWRRAEIVVTTVQSLLFNNKYQKLFSPTDFDLVISDEAHRSIGGNARAVFDYFIGYKLGLTATPRDYLRRFDSSNPGTRDPREAERRLLLDTYRTFGCENSQPTFRYSLLDGVKEGYLISPTVVDARTEITTELLSEEGFIVSFTDDTGEDKQQAFKQSEFEKRFFSDATNQLFCKTFLENALRDPVSGEIGKSIIFAVSQNHAAKLAQVLNQMADRMFPGKYQSDFAVQVTSQIPDSQQFTINFSNNNLLGSGNFLPGYKTSKARVCVTVGMMTTGYDCTDILANPPFMSPKGGIKPHKRFSVQSKRSEVLFVDYMAEHLTPGGRAGIIVPEGIIFQSQSAYKELRKMLVDNSLVAVISLPAGVFNPYSGVKTSILVLDKSLARQIDTIAFFKVENDGFGLGAQRREIVKNDLPQVAAEIAEYLCKLRTRQSIVEFRPALGLVIPKALIAANGDYNLGAERYREGGSRISHYPLVPIGEICDLINGRAFNAEDWKRADSGGLPIVRIQNLNTPDSEFNYYTGEVNDRYIINEGELLFSWSGSRGTSFGAHIWKGGKAVLNQHIFKVGFDESRATKLFLLHALNKAVTEVEENLHGGVGLVHITKGNLEKIRIPLPPLEVQKEIVAEIEDYQKVINGARAVLDHYRPYIPIQPDWPIVPLGEVIQGKPKNGYSGSPVHQTTGLKVLSLSATTSGKLDLSKFKFLDEKIPLDSPCRCRRGDIYLQRGNTKDLVGTAAIFDVDAPDFIYPDLMIRVRADEDKIRSHYLLTVLQSGPVREFVTRNAVGAAGNMPKINQDIVESIPIPLPPLSTQQAIVAEIEAEQALVAANRELMARFEQKIQAALARVWGEDVPAVPEA